MITMKNAFSSSNTYNFQIKQRIEIKLAKCVTQIHLCEHCHLVMKLATIARIFIGALCRLCSYANICRVAASKGRRRAV